MFSPNRVLIGLVLEVLLKKKRIVNMTIIGSFNMAPTSTKLGAILVWA